MTLPTVYAPHENPTEHNQGGRGRAAGGSGRHFDDHGELADYDIKVCGRTTVLDRD